MRDGDQAMIPIEFDPCSHKSITLNNILGFYAHAWCRFSTGICHLYESALSDALTSKRDGTLPPFEGERRRKSVNYNAQDLFK